MIGRDGDVRGAAFDHPQHRGENASRSGDFPPICIPCRRQSVIVPEQLIRAVDQMDFQGRNSNKKPYRTVIAVSIRWAL